jgi:membrane-associated PAP2 superfamily phosphatase
MASAPENTDTAAMRDFWLVHALLPAALVAAIGTAMQALDADRRIASAWFFDAGAQDWIGARSWWAIDFLHGGGTALVVAVGLGGLGVALGGLWLPRLLPYRRKATYLVTTMLLLAGIVALLKVLTSVNCPRELAGFGGTLPFVPVFGDRPDDLPSAACFPGSHASTGFSLMAFYFMLLDTRPRLARACLAGALALGSVFSIGQQARGAHFLSHDLASAALDWFLLLGLWALLLRSSVGSRSRLVPSRLDVQPPDTTAPRTQEDDRREAADRPHARRRRAGIRVVFQRLFCPRLPVCIAAPERGRGGCPRGRPGDPGQSDAADRRFSRGIGPLHLDLPDMPA